MPFVPVELAVPRISLSEENNRVTDLGWNGKKIIKIKIKTKTTKFVCRDISACLWLGVVYGAISVVFLDPRNRVVRPL